MARPRRGSAPVEDGEALRLHGRGRRPRHTSFPTRHRAKQHSTNPLERRGENRRCTEVVGIFAGQEAIVRWSARSCPSRTTNGPPGAPATRCWKRSSPSATPPPSPACRIWWPGCAAHIGAPVGRPPAAPPHGTRSGSAHHKRHGSCQAHGLSAVTCSPSFQPRTSLVHRRLPWCRGLH
ncbi:hypothetical protein EYW49_07525 [Siculibacillus lacustris]|uniref:Uncharacterized protein n=1 Tax=Siculibacillus lacustris TaxID=1549641 RepID=A0A4Q9VSH9_9HYPH|nr:hypothetical protein EYW49_07525 [Siculibacillus lacustris]